MISSPNPFGWGFYRVWAQVLIEMWRQHNNTIRPHSSLNYKPPALAAVLALVSQNLQIGLSQTMVQLREQFIIFICYILCNFYQWDSYWLILMVYVRKRFSLVFFTFLVSDTSLLVFRWFDRRRANRVAKIFFFPKDAYFSGPGGPPGGSLRASYPH